MKHSDHSTDNGIDGDVSGTSIQAGSIGEVHVNSPRWHRRYWLPGVAAAAVAAAVLTFVLVPDEQVQQQTPAAATSASPTETVPASSPSSGAPATSTAAGAARPAPVGSASRPTSATPIAVGPTTTTTVAVVAPPSATGVRFTGTLRFGSFHLDLAQPRDVPGTNLWRLTQNRLHGDDGYEVAEWLGDGVPGQAECAADLAKRATKDAENLIAGSRVCGRSPAGRIFRVDVVAIDGAAITGDVTVWE
ncbi:hypothetical protein [Lentzea flava]|uniref:Uncharacterized protein n=1 Tax=Lentzea flava TaxID=103732 RepID=A0ABQ2UB87_9PSEU|nr:hypothetical protein [Lentzea flava]MCP2196432.1 hypothetical protein [Lentzea flava]GGU17839.1 hypothetical protein GCM10010178_07420 [Lentzea flava]